MVNMAPCMAFVITCAFISMWNLSITGAFPGYFKLADENNPNRTNLYCPDNCKDREHPDNCCACRAKPLWELDNAIIDSLNLEYVNRRGYAVIYSDQAGKIRNSQFLKIKHSNGFLAFLPKNLCSFRYIVEIEFPHNLLTSVGNLSCLLSLDTLDMSHNRITYVSNETFTGLSQLRNVDLSHNLIRRIEPYTVLQESLELFTIDFSHNQLRDLDCTNIVLDKSFCKLKYDNNKIEEIVNENSFRIDKNKTYGDGGYVDIRKNNIKKFLNFTDLGVSDLTLLGKFFNFAFDLRESPLSCDCTMEPYLQKARAWINKMWKDYFDIKCTSPPSLAGKTIREVVARNKTGLDDLQCDISSPTNGCPTACKCYRQPSQDRTVVDCNSAGLTHLPKHMPPFNDLQVFLNNNSIKEIGFVSYLQRITHLDLSGNMVEKITEKAAQAINNNISIVLQGNNLKSIPTSFKSKDPCKLHLGYVYIPCNCQTQWVPNWLAVRKLDTCANLSNIFCETSAGNTPAFDFDFKSLDCNPNNSLRDSVLSVAGAALLCIVALALCYNYRYEIYLLRNNPTKPRKNNLQYKNDVYITVHEDDQAQVIWALKILIPYLGNRGYSVYFPPTDGIIGNIREEEIINQVGKSRNYIVLLTGKFTENGCDEMWQGMEWRYIWNSFKSQPHLKNIVIINYAQLRPYDFEISPIRAFLALNFCIDFANRKHMMLKNICLRLGNPNKFVVSNGMKLPKSTLKPRAPMNTVFPVGAERRLTNSTSVPNKYFDENKVFFSEDSYSDIESNKTTDKQTGFHSLSNYRTPRSINISI